MNSLLLELGGIGADKLVQKLRDRKIFIRQCDSMSEQFRDDFVRIAVKDEEASEGMRAVIDAVGMLAEKRECMGV